MKRLILLALAPLALLAGCSENGAGWWQKDWPLRTPMTVDTSTSGANLTGEIGRIPVLLRLHSGNFDFGQSADNGADLRVLAADNKTPLTYHIESFDPLLGVGTVWVDVPKLAGGEKQQLWLYHGNKGAPAGVDTAKTYDPETVLVLHYDEAPGTPIADKTGYRNNPVNGPTGSDEGSIIGRGATFAASPGMTLQPSGTLAIAAGGGFTFSTWVKPGTLDGDQALFARDGVVVGLATGVPYVSVGGARTPAGGPLAAGQWAHVALAADAKGSRLYVNGQEAAAAGPLPAMAGPLSIGGAAAAPFTGGLDETRIARAARPAAMIRADALGQGPEGKLVAFGKDEEQGAGGGTILFILKATPLLDWAVIALCMVLLALAIAVMVAKSGYIGRCRRANAQFMKRFRAMHEDLVQLDAIPDVSAGERKLLAASPLANLYEVGIEELELRQRARGDRRLSGEAVEALRAAVDAQQVAENQKLDRWMVLLTIAISGGPFIGLLGTVMGVMNTFGGVAMAGDVNVNAIAPGIAAALLATIAGLACAIPALFGYNYLNSQITALADEMRVFVDRLITRLAEMQANRYEDMQPPPHALAAE